MLGRMGGKGLLVTTYYYTLKKPVFQGILRRNLILQKTGAAQAVLRLMLKNDFPGSFRNMNGYPGF